MFPLGLGPGLDQVISVVLVLLVIYLVFRFGRGWMKTPNGGRPGEHRSVKVSVAGAIVRERYARGELDRNEYRRMMADLEEADWDKAAQPDGANH